MDQHYNYREGEQKKRRKKRNEMKTASAHYILRTHHRHSNQLNGKNLNNTSQSVRDPWRKQGITLIAMGRG